MAWPRKGVLIRLAIYLPIIGYLGWQAIEKWRSEQAVMEHAPQSPEDELEKHKRVIQLPDGRTQEIYELSPEQAERILGTKVPDSPGAEPGTAAPARPNGPGSPGTAQPPTKGEPEGTPAEPPPKPEPEGAPAEPKPEATAQPEPDAEPKTDPKPGVASPSD